MIHTIENESELPTTGLSFYIRSMSDKTVMLHGKSGDGYKRTDGERWDKSGYFVRGGQLSPGSAWADWSDA